MDEFRRIAALRGLPMVTLVSDRFPGGGRPRDMHADYLADPDALLATVRKELA